MYIYFIPTIPQRTQITSHKTLHGAREKDDDGDDEDEDEDDDDDDDDDDDGVAKANSFRGACVSLPPPLHIAGLLILI